jgi:Fe-S-cluster containining protein
MEIELDLNIIKRNSEIREEENFEFRSFLKGQDSGKIDEIVHQLYEEVLEHIDCTKCANCCIELETCFTKEEINSLTKNLNIDKNEFIRQSTKPDQFGDKDKYYLNSKPCQFLTDKKCTVYELRPEECNSYPYLHKNNFNSRLIGVIENYEICPIVYNVYELLKQEMNFKDMDYDTLF